MFTPQFCHLFRLACFITCITGSNCILFNDKTKQFYITKFSVLRFRLNVIFISTYTSFMVVRCLQSKFTGRKEEFSKCISLVMAMVLATCSYPITAVYPKKGVVILNQFWIFMEYFKREFLSLHYTHFQIHANKNCPVKIE
jgi:uncharacterized membrane protein (DUF485 family)